MKNKYSKFDKNSFTLEDVTVPIVVPQEYIKMSYNDIIAKLKSNNNRWAMCLIDNISKFVLNPNNWQLMIFVKGVADSKGQDLTEWVKAVFYWYHDEMPQVVNGYVVSFGIGQ